MLWETTAIADTLDIDLWIEISINNAENIQKAFNDFPIMKASR